MRRHVVLAAAFGAAWLAGVKITPPPLRDLPDPPLPIDDKVSCCESHDTNYMAWTRQHPGLTIGPQDIISDKGDEIYSFMRLQGIRNLLIMGVHTNMCILNRSFAIKRMTRMGVRCVLVRDLTDAAYDPAQRPFVSHEQGTELVVQHIEKYWCPSMLSKDLVARLSPK